MSDSFDPYRVWLGIPPESRPPTHFELLGISPHEQDRTVIEAAVLRQSGYVRHFQLGKYSQDAARILNEIAAAKACLLDHAKRAKYDAELNARRPAQANVPAPAAVPPAPSAPSIDLDEFAVPGLPMPSLPGNAARRPRSTSLVLKSRKVKRSRLAWHLPASVAIAVALTVAAFALWPRRAAEPMPQIADTPTVLVGTAKPDVASTPPPTPPASVKMDPPPSQKTELPAPLPPKLTESPAQLTPKTTDPVNSTPDATSPGETTVAAGAGGRDATKGDAGPTVQTGQRDERPPPPTFSAEEAMKYQEECAKSLRLDVEITGPSGLKLRLIPPGEFLMGSRQAEIDWAIVRTDNEYFKTLIRMEGPQHRVKLTTAFYLGRCEVTQQQYRDLMGSNPSRFARGGKDEAAVRSALGNKMDARQYPVDEVSWFDAVEFCNKLSEREQLTPYYGREQDDVVIVGGTGYRLPSEAEWEYACRAGTTTRWSFGDDEAELPVHAWLNQSSTHPVGRLTANPWGLFDMCGNAHEWCEDSHFPYGALDIIDPRRFVPGSNPTVRGGNCCSAGWDSRSAFRYCANPREKWLTGFRVARTAQAPGD